MGWSKCHFWTLHQNRDLIESRTMRLGLGRSRSSLDGCLEPKGFAVKPLFMCTTLLAVQLNVSTGQESVKEFQNKSGALIFRDGADLIIGM